MKLPLLRIPKPKTKREYEDRCHGISHHPELNESAIAAMGCKNAQECEGVIAKFEPKP